MLFAALCWGSHSCPLPCAVTCGFAWFLSKYAMLGDFPDAWFGGPLPIEPSFHLDARDVCTRYTRPVSLSERMPQQERPLDVSAVALVFCFTT